MSVGKRVAAALDALAKGAGLTSGAFYAHFDSKAEAFKLVVSDGLATLRNGIASFQERYGRGWRDPFVDFYLGERMEVGISEACGLPSFAVGICPRRKSENHSLIFAVALTGRHGCCRTNPVPVRAARESCGKEHLR